MTNPVTMVEVIRGPILESIHQGHVVICGPSGDIVACWGNPDQVILPRSSSKMIQALPLVESGAADAVQLGPEQLALACASHDGDPIHTERVAKWISVIGLSVPDLRCGAHEPTGLNARNQLLAHGQMPCQLHNNCSGKHAGFLTYTKHIKGSNEYLELDHPMQIAVCDAFEATTGSNNAGYGIDGCSAPNFATTVTGLARAMALFANATAEGDFRNKSAQRLTAAMAAHPELVAGEGRACTDLMRAAGNGTVIKTGADGVYTAIVPSLGMGVALKISDGATRASECAITAILVHLGVLDATDPIVSQRLFAPLKSWRGIKAGVVRPAIGFPV